MKAWINIYAIVLAAGTLTALTQETKTNTPVAATPAVAASTNLIASPAATTAISAPAAVVHKVKSPPAAPSTPTNAVPAQTNVTAVSATVSTSAPPVTGETPAPEEESLTPTNATPAENDITAAPPPENSGRFRNNVLGISVAIVVVVGGLIAVLFRRRTASDHASLITRAMSEVKEEDKHEERHEGKPEGKQGDTTVTRKFLPPMT
jgi:hypothetical protein